MNTIEMNKLYEESNGDLIEMGRTEDNEIVLKLTIGIPTEVHMFIIRKGLDERFKELLDKQTYLGSVKDLLNSLPGMHKIVENHYRIIQTDVLYEGRKFRLSEYVDEETGITTTYRIKCLDDEKIKSIVAYSQTKEVCVDGEPCENTFNGFMALFNKAKMSGRPANRILRTV